MTTEDPDNTRVTRDENGRFLPGSHANPAGRPVGSLSVMDAVRRKLQETAPGKSDIWIERLAVALLTHAETGKAADRKEILDRLEGKVPDKLDVKAEISLSADEIAEIGQLVVKGLKEGI